MKTKPTLLAASLLLSGCSAFNTVPLYKDYTPYQTFLRDREACVLEASQCVAKTYAKSLYLGETVERLLPSRGVYLGCMYTRGYYRLENGFVPTVVVKMTDYQPGYDCYGR